MNEHELGFTIALLFPFLVFSILLTIVLIMVNVRIRRNQWRKVLNAYYPEVTHYCISDKDHYTVLLTDCNMDIGIWTYRALLERGSYKRIEPLKAKEKVMHEHQLTKELQDRFEEQVIRVWRKFITVEIVHGNKKNLLGLKRFFEVLSWLATNEESRLRALAWDIITGVFKEEVPGSPSPGEQFTLFLSESESTVVKVLQKEQEFWAQLIACQSFIVSKSHQAIPSMNAMSGKLNQLGDVLVRTYQGYRTRKTTQEKELKQN